MPPSSTPDFDKPINDDPEINQIRGHDTHPIDLSSDPDYPKLLEHYQDAEFDLCKMFIDKMEKRYPGHPELVKFKQDIEMKLSAKTLAEKLEKDAARTMQKETLNLSLFAILGTIIVMIAFFISYYFFLSANFNRRSDEGSSQITPLVTQAEQLLNIGQPQKAAEVIERIRLIDPNYENLSELTSRTDELLRLEGKYLSALNLISENNESEALVIFKEIEAEKSGLWDVSQQIVSIETALQITNYLEEGNAAYQAQNWDQVVNAYESALVLDPSLDDPLLKEQLLNGYLNSIISMLQNENASIEDIETAEQYYRKAIALIPQNKEFTREKINLQEVSSDLLLLKFTETAKASLGDKNQTVSSIARAVSYLRKALNIDSKNTVLQTDLKNAEYYQIAFHSFINMDWVSTISNLNEILSTDANYANGNARILHFDAYYALGKQYYSAGLYQDALKNLEQAEFLAWDESDNLLKLFRVQVLIGSAYGKMDDYENAVSYYQYALDAIEFTTRLVNHPLTLANYSEALDWASNEDYANAFTAFQEVFENIDFIYKVSEIEIGDGVCLALFANENLSTLDAVIDANGLARTMVITFGRTLKVPMIEK